MPKPTTYLQKISPPTNLPVFVDKNDGGEYYDLSALPPDVCLTCKTLQIGSVDKGCVKCGSSDLIETGYKTDDQKQLYLELISLEREVTLATLINQEVNFNIYELTLGPDCDNGILEKVNSPKHGRLVANSGGRYTYHPSPNIAGKDQMSAVFRCGKEIQVFNINFLVKSQGYGYSRVGAS